MQESKIPLSIDGTENFHNDNLAPFYHGVASGDPLTDQVIIWTRVSPPYHKTVKVAWDVALDNEFSDNVRSGKVTIDSLSDYTVKVDVDGLTANTKYYYRFSALGVTSVTGETKTINNTGEDEIRLGVVSCSNYEFGYFSAYRHLANKELDAVIHLGDYLYEYAPGEYGDTTIGRFNLPPKELVSLSDYRTRYSQYRLDKDLQVVHQQHPFIAIWDDHEISNNSHKTGAENHQEDEGDYESRKKAAKQAYYEWLPIRTNKDGVLYRDFDFGELADVIVLDERLAGRSEPAESLEEVDDKLTMLGSQQLDWFKNKLSTSDAAWKIIGNQVIFSELELKNLRPENPKNLDAWDGYSTERDGIIAHIESESIDNVIFVTGDTHVSWAFEVPLSINDYSLTGNAVAIEFGTTSITSANWNESNSDEEVKGAEHLLMNSNPHLKFVNARDHGYFILTLTPDEACADWYYVDDAKDVNSDERLAKTIKVIRGQSELKME